MRPPRELALPVLVALCLATSTTARSSPSVFERASTCADPSFNHCPQAGVPSQFCCPSGNSCVPLAGNTTLLCCPAGSDCSSIQPINCDIQLQNATANPDNTLKTTELTVPLSVCGSGCCPFGYGCSSSGICVQNTDQSTAPSGSVSSSASASGLTSTSISTPSATSTTPVSINPATASSSSTNTTITAPLTETCSKFPISAILIGFFPGLVLGILLTLASICLLGAKRRKASRRKSGSSFGNISDPQPTSEIRTDFLRKPPQTPSSTAGSIPTRRQTVNRVKSLFGRSPSINNNIGSSPRPAPPIPLNIKRPMGSEERPVTPVREPAYQDIDIFADGDTASALRERERTNSNGINPVLRDLRASHQTTFSDMMERSGLAGLQKGQPYVYKGNSPGYSPSPKGK